MTTQRLSFLARQAYLHRDYSRLTDLADSLINLSARSEAAGRYYQALALSKGGKGKIQEAQNTFQQLADNSPLPIRSASILAMGVTAMQKGSYDEAEEFILEASRMSLSNNLCAPVITINAQNVLATILSIKGAHKESLEILRGLRPLAGVVGKYLPAIYYDYLNNTACELFSLGDVTTAAQLIKPLSESPLFASRPEWQETAADIQQAISAKHSPTTRVYVRGLLPLNVINIISHLRPNCCSEPTPRKADVIAFPLPTDTFYITLNHGQLSHQLFQFPFFNSEAYHERFIVFVHHLDSLATDEPSEFIVRGFISPDDPAPRQIERPIPRHNLNRLFNLLNYFEQDLKTLDKKASRQQEPIDLDEIQKTVKYLMPMLRDAATTSAVNEPDETPPCAS